MKKLIVVVMAITILAMAGVAMAADTATVDVSATVVGTCKFNSGGTVAFTLNPSVGGNVNGTVTQPNFWCTKNTSVTGITDDNGLNESGTTHRMEHNDAGITEYIEYSFTYTASGQTGLGKSNPISMNIASSVAEAQYINASAGDYSDTVVLTIAP